MAPRCSAAIFVAVTALSFSPSARAQDAGQASAGSGWYMGGEAGWAALGSEEGRIPSTQDAQVWSNGFAVGARVGYWFGPLRLEEEFRYGSDNLDRIGLHPAQGSRDAYAFMTNALYDFDMGWPVTPHVGVGIGAVELHDGARVAVLGIPSVDNSSDWVFGYQAIAGVSYPIASRVTVDLDYRYLATATPRFTTSPGLVIDGVFRGSEVLSSGYAVQTILGSLIWHFGSAP
jgi:opacity protein-like surface antigen